MSKESYPIDRKMLEHYSHQELIEMHKFYMFGPKENFQCQRLLGAIEFILSERVCNDLNKLLKLWNR